MELWCHKKSKLKHIKKSQNTMLYIEAIMRKIANDSIVLKKAKNKNLSLNFFSNLGESIHKIHTTVGINLKENLPLELLFSDMPVRSFLHFFDTWPWSI